MSSHISVGSSIFLAISGLGFLQPDPDAVNIGVASSIIKNFSPAKKKILDSDLPAMVLDFTSLKSQALQGGDAFEAGKKLADGQWHLGVLQGIEFAWAQAKDPKLQPLMIAVHRPGPLHAVLVAGKDSGLTGFADLSGKIVWIQPDQVHCKLFAERGAKGDAARFFGTTVSTTSVEDALDGILRGKIHAGVVDNASLEDYKDINPGKFARLKKIAESEAFPMTVIAYRQGMLSDGLLKKFRAGLLKANETDKGREAMANLQITAFEMVPANYTKLVGEIVKSYPPKTNGP